MKYFLAVLAVVLSFVMVTLAYVGENGRPRLEALAGEYERLAEKTESLRAENLQLKNQIEAFNSDYSTIERAAREQLGMVKKKEIILQFDR